MIVALHSQPITLQQTDTVCSRLVTQFDIM